MKKEEKEFLQDNKGWRRKARMNKNWRMMTGEDIGWNNEEKKNEWGKMKENSKEKKKRKRMKTFKAKREK